MMKQLRKLVHYQRHKLTSRANRVLHGTHSSSVYLFILAGPRTASTLLSEILNTSPNVSRNNPLGEGQYLPELKGRYPHRWNALREHDWHYIKNVWMRYWDSSKPVLIEKSPPNLKYAEEIERVFQPSYFLCLVRDPYAHCEGLMRRTGYTAERAAEFALECLSLQKQNLESLENTHLVRYEDLTERTEETIAAIEEWLPQLGKLRVSGTFSSYNSTGTDLPITNLNANKIAKIAAGDLVTINRVFIREEKLLAYFDYVVSPVR
jgi:hypothetical protein